MKLTGLSVYAAGVILVGAARLVLVASLFLLFQRVSGSARAAGLGVAIYAGNFNFLYWGAQFSYESLALPLLLLAMMALAEREAAPKQALRAWGAPVALAMMAIVVTHHLTSYATAALLVGLSLAYWYVHRKWSPPNPWPFAVFGILLAAFWLFVVASSTVGYLSPVLSDAFSAIGNTLGGADEPRGLFQAGSTSVAPTPLGARAVALVAVALLLAGLPFGLRVLWQRYRRQPFALLFGIAAIAFFATLALRLAPAAWETANRASEFLFIGLAFVLACACVEALRRWPRDWRTRPLIAAAIGLVLVGGAISGWPWDSQLARPLRASAAGATISSPPLAWPNGPRTCPKAASPPAPPTPGCCWCPGGKTAMAGSSPDIEDILDEEGLAAWMLPLLRRNELRYIAVDRREVSSDSLRGYYFSRRDKDEGLRPPSVSAKFNAIPGISRVYTNGPITVFDLGARAMRGHGDLEAAVGGAALCALLALALPFDLLRVLVGAPLFFFLPGYAIAAATFARGRHPAQPLPRLQRRPQPRRAGARRARPQLPAGRNPGRLVGAAALPRRPRRLPRSGAAAAATSRPPLTWASPALNGAQTGTAGRRRPGGRSPPWSSPSSRSPPPTRSATPRSGSSRWKRATARASGSASAAASATTPPTAWSSSSATAKAKRSTTDARPRPEAGAGTAAAGCLARRAAAPRSPSPRPFSRKTARPDQPFRQVSTYIPATGGSG